MACFAIKMHRYYTFLIALFYIAWYKKLKVNESESFYSYATASTLNSCALHNSTSLNSVGLTRNSYVYLSYVYLNWFHYFVIEAIVFCIKLFSVYNKKLCPVNSCGGLTQVRTSYLSDIQLSVHAEVMPTTHLCIVLLWNDYYADL